MSGACIEARGWGWQHAGRPRAALKDLTLSIEPGERVLLLGPSGAGKSTLLQALAGVLGTNGEGEELGSLTIDGHAPFEARGRAGLMLQDPQANTVAARIGDDGAFGCENLSVPRGEIWLRVARALRSVGLHYDRTRSTNRLSGGERQRMALAGILAMRPGLILLDEPTANLDPVGVAEVRDAVAKACVETGATLVVVEHRVEAWLDVVDRIVVLEPGGGVMADGRPRDVIEREGARLASLGIWIPGIPLEVDRTPHTRGTALMHVDQCSVGHGEQAVVRDATFEIAAGESIAIVGPNGAGKTTLSLALGGLSKPLAGVLEATPTLADGLGVQPSLWKSKQLVSRIGTVFQQPEHQFVTATVRAELRLGPSKLGADEATLRRIEERLMESLKLSHLAEANPFTLSGGEKRRLSVATALATSPRLILLDEPTFGQDRCTWLELARLMDAQVAKGTTLISITHDAALIELLGDRVLRVAPPTVPNGAENEPPNTLDDTRRCSTVQELPAHTVPAECTVNSCEDGSASESPRTESGEQ